MKGRRRLWHTILGRLLLSSGLAGAPRLAVAVPLPPPRPADLSPISPPPPVAPGPNALPPVCARILTDKTLSVAIVPPVVGAGGCGIAAPVVLKAVVLADGRRVAFTPPPLIRCDLAATLGAWIRDDVAPAMQHAGGLAEVLGSIGYECRTRDHIRGAKLSEHATGNAFDLVALVLRGHPMVRIASAATEQPALLPRLKASACARFTTVLGPGSDAFHKAHLHLDLRRRQHGFRICEWAVK